LILFSHFLLYFIGFYINDNIAKRNNIDDKDYIEIGGEIDALSIAKNLS
jgi:hypothetical protein